MPASYRKSGTEKLPLFGDAYKNADEIETNEQSVVLYDGWRDELGGVHRRPGLSSWVDLGTSAAIDGLYDWVAQSLLVAVSGGRVFTVNSSAIVTERTGATLTPGVPVSFATDGSYLFMAAGGQIVYLDPGTAVAAYVTDPQAPTAVTHVGFVDGYIVAPTVGSGQFNWSDVNDSLNWSAVNFATAEGSPDSTIAMLIKERELYFFGSESVEVWENVGDSTTFTRVPGGLLQEGCGAVYSIVSTENFTFWLSPNSQFKRYSGRAIETVSSPYDKELQSFGTISDCRAYRLDIVGRTFLVFTFPIENRTLVYNVTNDNWSEWGQWSPAANAYNAWAGNCITFSPRHRATFVGDRATGLMYIMSEETLTDNGAAIRLATLSGHVDHGTSVRKRNNRLRLRAKVGASSQLTTESEIMIRWKDNNKDWSNIKTISLGAAGPRNMLIEIEPRGIYRTRQWEISATDLYSPIVLVDAEEDLDFLR